jgi:hypothetical protein
VGAWIDFYLDHGRQPPVLFASLSQEQWMRATGQIGRRLGEFSRQELASAAWEEILLPLHLLADPPRLFQVHACCDALVASTTTPPVGVRAQEDLRGLLAGHPRLQAEIPGPPEEPIASFTARLERFRSLLFR